MAVVNDNYLFIYCEWLNDDLMKKYYPDAVKVTTGIAEDRAVRFVSYTDDSGKEYEGGCCAVKAPGELLYGVVWKLNSENLLNLDKLVSVGEGRYTRLYLAVKGDDGRAYACVSHSIKTPKDLHSHPSKAYLENMLSGAQKNNFPAEYIKKLDALA